MTGKFNVGGIPCHTVHDTVRLRLLRKALSCVSGPLSRARAYKLLIYTTVNVCTMLWDLHQNMPVRLRHTQSNRYRPTGGAIHKPTGGAYARYFYAILGYFCCEHWAKLAMATLTPIGYPHT